MRRYRYTLDANGEPQPCDDLIEWARWFETAERHVAHDLDEGDGNRRVRVSTVFLGVDHNFRDGPPLLWETMIFGGPHDGYQRRYSSRDAAYAGHQDACRMVTALDLP